MCWADSPATRAQQHHSAASPRDAGRSDARHPPACSPCEQVLVFVRAFQIALFGRDCGGCRQVHDDGIAGLRCVRRRVTTDAVDGHRPVRSVLHLHCARRATSSEQVAPNHQVDALCIAAVGRRPVCVRVRTSTHRIWCWVRVLAPLSYTDAVTTPTSSFDRLTRPSRLPPCASVASNQNIPADRSPRHRASSVIAVGSRICVICRGVRSTTSGDRDLVVVRRRTAAQWSRPCAGGDC